MAEGSQLNQEATSGLTYTAFITNVAVTLRLLLISRRRLTGQRKKDRPKKRDRKEERRREFQAGNHMENTSNMLELTGELCFIFQQ